MNAESFSTYLAQPAKLYQIPYQEIKNLVAEYPYSANLRRLLLLKSKIEQDPKFQQYLHDLASSTPDRKHLYEFVTSDIPQLLDLETEPEERLELQDLTLVREKDSILVVPEPEEATNLQASVIEPPLPPEERSSSDNEVLDSPETEPPSLADDLEADQDSALVFEFDPPVVDKNKVQENQAPLTKLEPEEEKEVAPAAINSWAELDSVADVLVTPDLTPPPTEHKEDYQIPPDLMENLIAGSRLSRHEYRPQPKSRFESWQKRHATVSRDWKSFRRIAAANQASPKAREIAKQSVQDPANLASETLAKLLARQGQYRKAIKIYQRLSLLYPEKSRYFAATIEKLKQKL